VPLVRAALLGACAALAAECGAASGGRSSTPVAAPPVTLDPATVREQVRDAAVLLNATFAHQGAEGLLALRLRQEEVGALFTENAAQRIARLPRGLYPSAGEQRWRMFATLSATPLVGFCARGVRVVEANGAEGFAQRALVVDRLLLVGSEPGGLWGAWVENLVLTPEGWRLAPLTPYERQVETPRRDHADVQLWDCDLGQTPRPAHPL
jgi:hypothetical protein